MIIPLTLFFALLCLPLSLASGGKKFDYRPGSHWGGICDIGTKQSPVNIAKTGNISVQLLHPSPFAIEKPPPSDGKIKIVTFGTLSQYLVYFTGTNLKIEFDPDDFSTPPELYIPADDYTIGDSTAVKKGQLLKIRPLQFHFHTASEHTFDGAYGAAELHIVNQVEEGESDYCDRHPPCLAVFGVMLMFPPKLKGGNPIFDRLVKRLPRAQGPEHGILMTEELNMDDIVPSVFDYYTYLGSLTTPPCTEIVTWIVFKESVPVSTKFIERHQYLVCYTSGDGCFFGRFQSCFPPREKTNNRIVQKLNGRKVYSVIYKEPTNMEFVT